MQVTSMMIQGSQKLCHQGINTKGMSPNEAKEGMWWHEPPGLANALVKSVLTGSLAPYNKEKADSDSDIKNNDYAAKRASSLIQ